jgi:hypothetical protein
MKTFRIIGLVVALAIIGYHLFTLDYEDLRFNTNRFHYLQVGAMTLIAVSFLLGIIKDRKQNS